jgi:hypothetical protein
MPPPVDTTVPVLAKLKTVRGSRRLGNRLAIPAGELLTDVLDDFPAPRLAFKGLRHRLAELVQPLAAAFTAGARHGFDDTFDRQTIVRTARALPWPTSASAIRFPGGRRSLRSWPASAARAAQGSSRAQRQGRREADQRSSSHRQINHIRRKIPPDFLRESKSHSLTASLGTPGCLRHPPIDAG